MKKLVIAVDCDDVLVPSTEHIVRVYNQRYGTNISLQNAHTSNSGEWGAADKEEVMGRVHDIQLTPEYGVTKPYDEAVATCRRLAEQHEIHLVTARAEKLIDVTQTMLDQYFPKVFTRLEHLGVDGDKGEVCRAIGADVLVDDNQKHLLSAQAQGVIGLLWFGNYPWQAADTVTTHQRIVRCLDWISVEKEIERLARE